jgi:hypothetical protein
MYSSISRPSIDQRLTAVAIRGGPASPPDSHSGRSVRWNRIKANSDLGW